MRKIWLATVGLVAMGATLLSPVESAHAAAKPPPKCGSFNLTKPWGDARGQVCWGGQQTRGGVQDRRKDGMAVFVRVTYTMRGGATRIWDSPEACGPNKSVRFTNPSPRGSVSAKAELRTKRQRTC